MLPVHRPTSSTIPIDIWKELIKRSPDLLYRKPGGKSMVRNKPYTVASQVKGNKEKEKSDHDDAEWNSD